MLKNDLIAWLITVAAAAVGLKNWPGLGLAGLFKLQGKEGLLKTFFENLNLSIHFLENYNVIYYNLTVAGPEKLKKSRPEKLVQSNKSIS